MIYGGIAWLNFDVWLGELHMYAESVESMKVIKKDHSDGKVIALAANPTVQQAYVVEVAGLVVVRTTLKWITGVAIRDHRCSKCGRQARLRWEGSRRLRQHNVWKLDRRGISGHQINTTAVGTLPGLDGLALVIPDDEDSL